MTLFDFDPAEIASIEAAHARDLIDQGEARAQRARHRRQVRHAKAEAQLASIEQTAIHADRGLFDFYREFFSHLRSIDRAHARSQG